jgi:calcineurin-like phosphoesterase family protein
MNTRSNIFVIADLHFNDQNIIRYANRPFKSVEEMNKTLVENWNNTVKSMDDIVFVLGDLFSFRDISDYPDDFRKIIGSLFGKIYLIKGNHEIKSNGFYQSKFYGYSEYPIIIENFFMLSHEPLLLSETTPYFNLYGHVHNDNRYVDTKTSMCVSAERIGYTPISLDEIRARWTEKYLYRKENDNE